MTTTYDWTWVKTRTVELRTQGLSHCQAQMQAHREAINLTEIEWQKRPGGAYSDVDENGNPW